MYLWCTIVMMSITIKDSQLSTLIEIPELCLGREEQREDNMYLYQQ
jgi:hypothetical protein